MIEQVTRSSAPTSIKFQTQPEFKQPKAANRKTAPVNHVTETALVPVPEDNTGQFFGNYISRVAELQAMTKEACNELDDITDSDDDIFR